MKKISYSKDVDALLRGPLFDLAYIEYELKTIFYRDIDLVTRKSIEASRNYLRRKAILSSAKVIYGTRSPISS